MKRYFLSYAHDDNELANLVQRTLEMSGIRTWRDRSELSPGIPYNSEIKEALDKQACEGLIIIATRPSLESDFIRTFELAEAYQEELDIVPLFVGVDLDYVRGLIPKLGFDLTQYEGVAELPGLDKRGRNKAEFRAAIVQVAAKLLRRSLEQRAESERNDPLRIALHAFEIERRQDADVELNWTSYFEPRIMAPNKVETILPTADEWEKELLPSLIELRKAIKATLGSPDIHLLCGDDRLPSVGLALGYVFGKDEHFHLTIEQHTASWSTRAEHHGEDLLVPDNRMRGGGEANSAEVALGLSIIEDVGTHLSQLQGMQRKINLQPPDRPNPEAVQGESLARRWVDQIAGYYIARQQNRSTVETLHLYSFMPFAMAVMLGWWYYSHGTIQVHEWDRKAKWWARACALTR